MNQIQQKNIAAVCLTMYLLLYNINFFIIMMAYYEPFCFPDFYLIRIRFFVANVILPILVMSLLINIQEDEPSSKNKEIRDISISFMIFSIVLGIVFVIYFGANKGKFACAINYRIPCDSIFSLGKCISKSTSIQKGWWVVMIFVLVVLGLNLALLIKQLG